MSRALETLALFTGDPSQPRRDVSFRDAPSNHLWLAAYFPKLALESLAGISADEAERGKLQSLARHAERFTPIVSLEPPSALLMEVGGSLKLFDGIDAIKDLLAAGLRQRQVTAHLCAAPTALAALWLARSKENDVLSRQELAGRLGRLPVEATEWPRKVLMLLESMGVRTLGECMRLPRDGFARRIGREYLNEIDKSLGDHDPRLEFRPPLELDASFEFANEVTDTAALESSGKRLIENLVVSLRKHQAQTQSLECVFRHSDRSITIERMNLAEPTRDEDRFVRLFMDRLEQMRVHAPVVALSIKTGLVEPAHVSHGALFEGSSEHDPRSAGSSLIERLQARFGMKNLYGMDLVDEHRPEAAWSRSRHLRHERHGLLAIGQARRRPLWILPAPRPLSSTVDGLPCYKSRRPLRLECGPERIESGWWDDGGIERDYHIALSDHDERLWVFRDRSSMNRGWYLHGFFA
jgi:protein ImuB